MLVHANRRSEVNGKSYMFVSPKDVMEVYFPSGHCNPCPNP
jgi:hypothetical protein